MSNQQPDSARLPGLLARPDPGERAQVDDATARRSGAPARGDASSGSAQSAGSRSAPRSRRPATQVPMKSVAVSGAASSKAAATPPQRPWPMTTMELTPRASTANSSAALRRHGSACRARTPGPAPRRCARRTARPGRASKTVSGPDRESEQATTIVGGPLALLRQALVALVLDRVAGAPEAAEAGDQGSGKGGVGHGLHRSRCPQASVKTRASSMSRSSSVVVVRTW